MFFPERAPLYAVPQAVAPEWEITERPAAVAIDLDTVKTFLTIPLEDHFFDAEKSSFIVQAQRIIEKYCRLSLITTTWVGNFPAFFDEMRLIRRPFCGVTKVEYVDATTGEITTLDPATYIVGKAPQRCGVLCRADGAQWPVAANRVDAVRVTVTAGWAKANIPDEIINAILQTIAALDHQRADEGASQNGVRSVYALKHQQAPQLIPVAAQALLSEHKYFAVVAG